MRNFLTFLVLTVLVCVVPATQVQGEDLYPAPEYAPVAYGRRPYGYWPYGYNPYLRGRAAWLYGAGAYLQGGGELLRGSGEGEYWRSLGAINREQARRLYIENRQQAAETYFNMKRLNRAAREELAAPRATAQDLSRYAKDRLPDVLSEQQYDRENGVVTWPLVLLRKEFAADRELIDALALQRSSSNVVAPEVNAELAAATNAMLGTLRAEGTEFHSTDYITAMKFIKSLNYDARVNPTQAASPSQYAVGTPSLETLAER